MTPHLTSAAAERRIEQRATRQQHARKELVMKQHWRFPAILSTILLLSACAAPPPQRPFEGHQLADSWEARYLEAWGDSGL